VARCAPGEVVVDNRICATTCPAGQTAEHGFCGSTEDAGEIPICNGQAIDEVAACCNPRGGLCRAGQAGDCCSGACNGDGICVGVLGESCTFNADGVTNNCADGLCARPVGGACTTNLDCVTKNCVNGVCAKSPVGGFCNGDGDCLFNVCLNHQCQGGPGSSCQDSSQCDGICEGADPIRGTAGTCCLGIGAACTAGGCCGGSTCQGGLCTKIIR
jgi:hypothetical protein